jgi:hypothetical protein
VHKLNAWLILCRPLGDRGRGRLEFRAHQGGQLESAGMGSRGERQCRRFLESRVREARMDWRALLVVQVVWRALVQYGQSGEAVQVWKAPAVSFGESGA